MMKSYIIDLIGLDQKFKAQLTDSVDSFENFSRRCVTNLFGNQLFKLEAPASATHIARQETKYIILNSMVYYAALSFIEREQVPLKMFISICGAALSRIVSHAINKGMLSSFSLFRNKASNADSFVEHTSLNKPRKLR